MQEDFILILCGIAGVLFQCLLKLNGLLNDARTANINFSWKKDYVKRDFVSIMISFLSVAIWYLIFREVSAKSEAVANLKRVSFVTMGGIGSFVIQYFMGGAKNWVRQIIDHKTDLADGKNPKTPLPPDFKP